MNNSNKNSVTTRLKLVAAIASFASMFLYALPAPALGIGEPKSVSNLFEPLRVDVPIEAGVADASELNVRLMIISDGDTADPSVAAESLGLQREILTAANGQRFLRVTSPQTIREPVLSLRVDLSGNSVMVRKDLTLLFDPPGQATEAASRIATPPATKPAIQVATHTVAAKRTIDAVAPAAEVEAATQIPTEVESPVESVPALPAKPVRPVAASSATPTTTPVRAPRASAARVKTETVRSEMARNEAQNETSAWLRYGPVRADETLDAIAEQTRGSQAIPVPMMAMLLRWLNPAAFRTSDGQLRTGATLKFPSPDSLATQMAANGTVWAPGIVAVAAASVVPAPARLRLVSLLSYDSLSRVANAQPTAQVAASTASAPEAQAAPQAEPAHEQPAAVTAAASIAAVAATPPAVTKTAAPQTTASPPAARPTASSAAAELAPTVAASVFPTWLIGVTLLLSALTLGYMMRVLHATPAPVMVYPERPALTRSVVVNPMLEQAPEPARRSLPPVEHSPGDSIVVSETDWNLEMFDLLRAESEVVVGKAGTEKTAAQKPSLRRLPGDSDPAAPDWLA